MPNVDADRIERDRQRILEARSPLGRLWVYTRLSGPGWLQSAITLGGGSLTGSLYLGVLAGFSLMWLQPLAMIFGVIMLSAIAYATLSTGKRPFAAINQHVNPLLGWSWAIATLMANLVWCMPQFALGTAAIQQNLAPEVFGEGGSAAESIGGLDGDLVSKAIVIAILFVTASFVVWFYDSGGWGIRLFEWLLKLMVAVIVVCFFGVVIKMSIDGGLDGSTWKQIGRGFVPDFSLLTHPSNEFDAVLKESGAFKEYWSDLIIREQRQVMLTAAATAVGINMTFLLPYSMLARGWNRDFRGLGMFDLSTGLFVPFVLATSCVVIASASQFHAQPAEGLLGETTEEGEPVEPAANLVAGYHKILDARLQEELIREHGEKKGEAEFQRLQKEQEKHDAKDHSADEHGSGPLEEARDNLPEADRRMAAMLVRRDAFNLANSLRELTDQGTAQYVFGIGVLGMAISTIIILMLINGFVVCEMLGLEPKGMAHRLGALLAAITGAAGPFLYQGEAKFWLAVPTSLFGFTLLPIAYFTFYLMMNNKGLLGENRPRGFKRLAWNIVMAVAALLAAFGSYWSIRVGLQDVENKFGLVESFNDTAALIAAGIFIGLAVVLPFQQTGGKDESSSQ